MRNLISSIYHRIYNFLPKQNEIKIALDAGKYWSSSSCSEKIQDYSHWRGKGRWQDAKWLQIGTDNYEHFVKLCAMSDKNAVSVERMVEWGPGGGSNAIQFAKSVSDFYAVDISQSNLDETRRQLENVKYNGYHPIIIQPDKPAECLSKIPSQVDFFLSTAVFQHFPSKSYGIQILSIANKLLKPGGLALIQIRYDENNSKVYHSKGRDYKLNAITFTSYKIAEFWELCSINNLTPLYIYLSPDNNYAFYYLNKAT